MAAPGEDGVPAAGRPNLPIASDPPALTEPSEKWELESTAQAPSGSRITETIRYRRVDPGWQEGEFYAHLF